MTKLRWVERKFNFDFPLLLYPDIIERVRGTPARIEDRVRDVPPSVLTRRPESTWSIQENIGHLLDLEGLHLGRLDDYAANAQTLRAADMTNRATHEAGHNDRSLVELLGAFRRERGRFVERLEQLSETDLGRTALHPRLGQPMRQIDCVYFCACHDDYHLARISELLRLFR
jgi:hypothetical protein